MNRAQLGLVEADVAAITDRLGNQLDRLEGSSLLITGANGFVVSYMVDTVAWLNQHRFRRPCHIWAGVRSPINPDSRLGHLLGRSDVTFIEQDVRLPYAVEPAFIVHAASNASPKKYLAAPLDTIDANVTGTRHLLDLALQTRTKGFLFFSSSEIYGEVDLDLIPESCFGQVDPVSPRACYTESKRLGETLCRTYWQLYRMPVNSVRLFQTYGPGMQLDDGRVVADFLRNRIEQQPIRLLSDGSAVRSFCYLSDAVTGLWQILLSDQTGEVFNIGSDESYGIRDFATLISRLEEPELALHFAEPSAYSKGSPSRSVPDLSKARQLLGYQPQITLAEGLQRTLTWHRG